jgi:tetratricopeptide (TPR) repeat protein
MGRHEEAVRAFGALAELSPDPSTRLELARELAAAGRPAEAITQLEAAIALRPTARHHLALGQVLRSQDRPEEAGEAFRKATAGNLEEAWDGLAAVRLDVDGPPTASACAR